MPPLFPAAAALLLCAVCTAHALAPLLTPPRGAPLVAARPQRPAMPRPIIPSPHQQLHPPRRRRAAAAESVPDSDRYDFQRALSLWTSNALRAPRRSLLRSVLALEEKFTAQQAARAASGAMTPAERAVASTRWAATHAACDIGYQLLFPAEYGAVRRWHASRLRHASTELATAERRIASTLPYALGGTAANATVVGRVKSARSVFEKARMRGCRVDDLLALRVIVEDCPQHECCVLDSEESFEHCHAVASLVGSIWPDAVVASKDYLASPKGNGYRSLHLSVRLPSGTPLEVQIRSRCMHEYAERGAASHAAYKAGLRDSWLRHGSPPPSHRPAARRFLA